MKNEFGFGIKKLVQFGLQKYASRAGSMSAADLLKDDLNHGRFYFFKDNSRVVMAKEHHQYDIEELIALSKKKEGVK